MPLTSPPRLPSRRLAAVAVALLLGGCAVRPAAEPPGWLAPPFIVTFWCAPPLAALDDARLAEIAAAGFTTIGAPCDDALAPDANRRVLAAAARHGLRMWVADHRLYAAVAGGPTSPGEVAAAVAPVVADYRDLPALDGYMVADEPTARQFDAVAPVVAALRAADPTRLAYVNLLPNYIPPALLFAPSYDDYLENFVATVQPQLLSVDHYPFGLERDRTTFFPNLDALRAVALRHDLPFLWILLAMPHGPYRQPSEGELAWQIHHALAYGARGVSYFAYWTPPPGDWDFRHGLLDQGTPTPTYAAAARLNPPARAIGDALAGWRSLAVADSAGTMATPLPIGPLAALAGGAFTIGLFGDGAGGLAALIVNRDYRAPVVARLTLRAGAAAPQVFDAARGAWESRHLLEFPLAPGAAQLLRWPG